MPVPESEEIMGDEFEDTSVDTGSDVDTSSDSGESFDDSSMDAGDEAIDDSGSEGLDDGGDSGMDDSGESFDDSSMDACDEPIDDSGAEGLDDSDAGETTDESGEATDDSANDLPDGDAEGTDEPVDESAEATDDVANDLPDGDAEGTDEPVDESSEATDDGANDLPDGDTEGTDEPVDESGEATDDGANDLPDGDAEGSDEPVDESSEATDDGANDLPDGDAEGTDEPADESSEATDDGANDLPDGDAEGTDGPADESSEANDDGANGLPDGDGDAEGTDENSKSLADASSDVNSKITPEQADDVKNRIRKSQQQRTEHPSGYRDFDQGKTNILTNEPAKLSSKNFDRLAEERGLSPEEAANQKYSMNEYQRPDPSLNGAEHHPDKTPDDYATARHILEPEQVYNYNNGVPRDGYEHASSGVYQTPEMQSAPNMSEQAAAQENLALPQSNDARVRSDSTLNPTLENGKQHNVIEGTAAPQNAESANAAFKAEDGLDRHGGGKQIITDGGYGSGAVTEGDQHNIGDMNTDLNNPHLFDNHPAGEYGYTNASDGKSGFGQLDNSQKGIRDTNAQRMVGGSDRRSDDDGGHYIANMFNGDSGSKNLDPQNRNLNRGDWKAMENNQNAMLNNGDKVFTNNHSMKMDGSDRPVSYDAYTIVEHPDGSREAFPYHFKNESNKPKEIPNQTDKFNDDSHRLVMDAPNDKLDYSQLQQEDATIPDSAELGFHNGKAPLYDDNKSDLQNAQDDLDYAKQQEDAYTQAIKDGSTKENPETRQQLADAREYAQNHLKDIENGQKYSYDRPSEYWDSPEGREISGDIHAVGFDQATKRFGEDPTGSVSNASKDFGRFYGENYGNKVIGKTADISQDMMKNTHDQYGNQAVKDMNQQFPLRDQDGNPVDASGKTPQGVPKKSSFWNRNKK